MALGSDTLALSTTAAALPAHPCSGVVLANNDAAINMLVGNASAQNFTLKPGATARVRVRNSNQVYVKSASGTPTISFLFE